MDRENWPIQCLLVLAAAVGQSLAQETGPPPNILIVILDDLGVDQLAVYGEAGACSVSGSQCFANTDCPVSEDCLEDYAATPRIDQIASEGVMFRNVWAAPTCKPARVAGITGRYGLRTGVVGMADTFPASERTIAEALKDPTIVPTVYATAVFGKWGIGSNVSPLGEGFDFFAGRLGPTIGGNYFDWGRTVGTVTSSCSPGSPACPGHTYATTVNVNDAINWLSGQTEPWFIWLSFNAPHSPFHVPPHNLVSPETLARLPTDGMGGPAAPGTTCIGIDRRICYLAAIEAVDAELTRFLGVVPANTWIIVLADNGTSNLVTTDPFDPFKAKGTVYEGGINIPMIVRAPDMTSASAESAAHVHIVDLFATSVELAGAVPPQDRLLDSLSLVPLVHDPSLSMRAPGYAVGSPGPVARDERYKLFRGSPDEFYDLEGAPPGVPGDPFEQTDLLLGTLTQEEQDAYDALDDEIVGMNNPAGRIPDGNVVAGVPLTANRAAGNEITLSWGASCGIGDNDYGVYEGLIGNFTSHAPVQCSSLGGHSATFAPQSGNTYYLVVPSNGQREGSYGTSSAGVPRLQGTAACFPRSHAGCE